MWCSVEVLVVMGWRTGGDFVIEVEVVVVPELLRLVLLLLRFDEEKMVAEAAIFRADRALYSSG